MPALEEATRRYELNNYYHTALSLVTSGRARNAFDLSRESNTMRDRYGRNTFGACCLLARRLVEAGTRFVQVNWYSEPAWHGWDVHGADLPGIGRMESPLCPRLDQGLSTLLEDLHQRGRLDSTLVVWMGEFGRTPQINQLAGRDHWPDTGCVLFSGAGLKGGQAIGATDAEGGKPVDRKVAPEDVATTIYQKLGIDYQKQYMTPQNRPVKIISGGEPIKELF